MEDYVGACIHSAASGGFHTAACGRAMKEAAASGKPMLEQAPGWNCDPWRGVYAGAIFLARTVAHGGPTLKLSVPEGPHPTENTCAVAVLEELQPMVRTHRGALCEGLCPVGGTTMLE